MGVRVERAWRSATHLRWPGVTSLALVMAHEQVRSCRVRAWLAVLREVAPARPSLPRGAFVGGVESWAGYSSQRISRAVCGPTSTRLRLVGMSARVAVRGMRPAMISALRCG